MRYLIALFTVSVLAGGGCKAAPPSDNSRDHLIAGYTLILESWDKDGDRKLSRAEIQAMDDIFAQNLAKEDASRGRKTAEDLDVRRQELIRYDLNQDTNHDGFVTFDELLKQPLASFDCMDVNHDGKLSKEEVFSGSERCPSINLADYAPKP